MFQLIGTRLHRVGTALGRLRPPGGGARWRDRFRMPERLRLDPGRWRSRLRLPDRFQINRQQLKRRLVQDSILVGTVLTLLVVLLDLFGALVPLDWWFYDRRAHYCQFFTPRPTESVVHIDIDDAALEDVQYEGGRWPWKRTLLAEMFDEIRLARPKAVVLDIIFPEREEPELQRRADGQVATVDHDSNFARSLKELGSALVPVSALLHAAPSPLAQAVQQVLVRDPEASEADLSAALLARGFTADQVVPAVRADATLDARRQAFFVRIRQELEGKPLAPEEQADAERMALQRKILKQDPSPHAPLFTAQYLRARDAVAIQRFLIKRPAGFPRPTDADLALAPYERLGNAAVATGFIDYLPYEDGTVRSVPLFVESEGRMLPQMGLTIACMMTGADLSKVSYDNGAVVIPRPAGQPPIRIPVRTYFSRKLGRDIPLMMDIPWFGGEKWERMYDTLHQSPRQHMSMARVWGLIHTRRQILRNNQQADLALGELWKLYDPDQAKKYAEHPLAADDWAGRAALMANVLENKDDFTKAAIDLARQSPEAKRTPEEVHTVDAANALEQIRRQNPRLQGQLAEGRRLLASEIQGKAVLIGHIATGLVRDKVPTSLHAECPGVVVHGVIYNGIVTGELWRFLPHWVTVAWTITLGLLTTFTTARLPPARALFTAGLLIAGFVTVNFLLLFDYGNVVLGVAGPVVVIGTVWGGCTLARLVIERRERTLITQRFRNYVDPKLVDYVTAHPDQVKFEGQTREMTVVFTDLGNFTPLTARLGEKTVPLLNEFLGRMVPVIRKHNGYVNKFLGDGIMFFYNAPELNPNHARDSIATCLEMQEVLAGFNRDLAEQGLPGVTLRAGVSTGSMIVGDAGTADASDYTVLGDAVNYGSRLEGANKAFGSSSLITERTVRQGGGEFLLRPLGKPAVVGRQEQQADLCYEVLARLDQATDAQRRLAELTRDVVDCFMAGRFSECLAAIDRMEGAVGADKFTRLYRDECLRILMDGPPANFHGQIVLTEK